jgi:TPR repeat protein
MSGRLSASLVLSLSLSLSLSSGCEKFGSSSEQGSTGPAGSTGTAEQTAELAPAPAPCTRDDLPACERACNEASDAAACLVIAVLHEGGRNGRAIDYSASQAAFQRACDLGDADGCAGVGLGYAWGLAREDDPERGVSLLADACAKGSARGCFGLADAHNNGRGASYDPVRALALFEQACEAGELRACADAGIHHQYGIRTEVDAAKATALYRRACTDDELNGCVNLAWARLEGELGLAADPAQAFAEFERLCADASPAGCYGAGFTYQRGQGTEPDFAKARARFDWACDHEYLTGCTDLAMMTILEQGSADEHGPKHASEAFAELERMCGRGDDKACYELGVLFGRGEKVERDLARAEALFTQLCEHDGANACVMLGRLHHNTIDQHDKALASYLKACDSRSMEGCFSAASLLAMEPSIKDEPRARALTEKACAGKHPSACEQLAWMLERGFGGPVDVAGARTVYQSSCDAGAHAACLRLARSYLGEPDTRAQGLARLDALCMQAKPPPEQPSAGETASGTKQPRERKSETETGISACSELARHYSARDPEVRDLGKARTYYERGCALEDGYSCVILGGDLLDGREFEPDPAQGLALLERACKLEQRSACTSFAVGLVEAPAPHADPDRGLALLDAACRTEGESSACRDLTRLYHYGTQSLLSNPSKAVEYAELQCFADATTDLRKSQQSWACHEAASIRQRSKDPALWDGAKIVAAYERACELESAYSCGRLAELYENGTLASVPADPAKAKAFHAKACAHGQTRSCGK